MNRNQYRVIFNRIRGLMMVVAENMPSKSRGHQRSGSRSKNQAHEFALTPLKLAVWLITGSAAFLPPWSAMAAGIVADPNAPANQRPNVTSAANGVPLVNIQSPSPAGVSRNTYSQFDVSRQGAILNNSKTNVQTQLGGWVQGNPNITGNTARVILNEVNSSNPSLLNGYMEIAGSRAQLVIANPAGISCDGCGFINANRATLTTGTPVMNGGDLLGYRVGGGTIEISGAGLDATQVNFTDVVARAVKVNAEIFANQLNVTTGSNQVNIDANGNQTSITPIAPDAGGSTPVFALDVAALGGMYAGKIHVIGTEAGVGVRNASTIGASAGEVRITADGLIQNAGVINAVSDIQLDAVALENDGRIAADGNINIGLASDYIHTDELQAGGNLVLHTTGDITNQSALLASQSLTVSADNINNTAAGEITALSTQVSAANTLTNYGLIDGVDTRVDATTVVNTQTGSLFGDRLAIQATHLDNNVGAVIAARNQLDLGIGSMENSGEGLIFSAQNLAVGGSLDGSNQATGAAASLINDGSTIEALGSATFAVSDLKNLNSNLTTRVVMAGSGSFDRFTPRGAGVVWDSADYPGAYIGNVNVEWRNAGPYRFREYTRYLGTKRIYQTQVVSSNPGQILSGGDMAITGSLTNKDSQMIAGGNLDVSGATVQNLNTKGQTTTSYTGTSYYYDWDGNDNDYDVDVIGAYNPANTVQTFNLSTTRLSGNTTPVGSGTSLASAAVPLVTNSLFQTNPDTTSDYLIETNPRFANYQTWLSSDYMMQQLSFDPAITQKRVGDGFYEQQLVREQVAQLTGRRFLTGYANDEAQFQALMTCAVTHASTLQLVPGIALTTAQIAQLTSDIVWLVEQEVALPDGTITKALVPQVYVKLQPEDLHPSTGIMSGNTVSIALSGDMTNEGTIAGRNLVALTADNINNLGGQTVGDSVQLNAVNDINNIGGHIVAKDVMALNAGNDINLRSTTESSQNSEGASSFSRINIDRVAGLYISNPDAILVASAGNDVNLMAASIVNQGANSRTQITAARDIKLGTVAVAENNSSVRNAKNYVNHGAKQEVGSVVETSGNVVFNAGNDFNAKAASVTSETGAINVSAAKDIHITEGRETSNFDTARKVKKSGTFSSTTKYQHDVFKSDNSVRSSFSGDTVALQAGDNINIRGSNVVSDSGTSLVAGDDINIAAAKDTAYEFHERKTKKSGLSTSGASVTLGTQKLNTKQTIDSTSHSSSTVGSVEGNVEITAGKTYEQNASDVLAPEGDIDISAQKVEIIAAQNVSNQTSETKFKQSGITVSISNPVVSAIQTVDQMQQAASETSDSRMKALAAATSALSIKNAYESVNKGMTNPEASLDKKLGGIDVSFSVGSSKSSSNSSQSSVSAVSSRVAAGGDVTISAIGAANNSDINIVGSRIDAGGDTTMIAEDQINLRAAKDSSTLASSSKNSSASVGVSVGTNGTAVTASVSKGNSKSNGSEISWTETVVQSGETTNLISGGDTRLIGAQVKGNQVVAEVGTVSGGNLDIQSLQDTSNYDSKSKSGGFSVSVPIGAGNYGASMSSSSSKIKSDYASVNEQSGIFAGDKGFQVSVADNTNLKGAIIASTEQAILESKNSLVTGTLTASNIKNHAEYKGESSSFSAGVGRHISADGTTRNAPSASAGYSSQEDEASSVTLSGVSGGAVSVNDNTAQIAQTGKDSLTTVALLNRDTHIDEDGNAIDSQGNSTAATLSPIFDQQNVERELNAAVAITQAFSLVAPKAVGDFATNKVAELETEAAQAAQAGDTNKANELKAEAAKWDEGGAYRVALHATIGGLITGDLSGAASAGAIASAAPLLTELQEAVQETLEKSGLDDSAASSISQALAQITSFGIGNAIAGTVGSAVALPVDTNNRQLHPREENWIKENAKRYAKEQGITEDEAIAQLTQQALRNVDLLWRALLSDGDDQRAQDFLSQSQDTFINELGETQRLFTAPTQQLLRPEMLATEVSQDFYKAFAQSGISRSLTQGLAKELKDSGLGIIRDVNQLAQALYDQPVEVTHAIVDGIWKAITQLPHTMVDTVQETGTAIGESAAVAFNEDITSKLNAIYGTNVADIQKAISAIRVIVAVTGSAAAAKGITNISEVTAKAVTEKLDTLAKEASRQLDRAAEQTLIRTGGVIDPTTGLRVLDLASLTNDQKRIIGELFGENTVKQIIPDGIKLARLQGTGTTGIDDLYKVDRPDVDYVVIEYKFVGSFKETGVSALDKTPKDGLQGSSSWLLGSNRIEKAVGSEVEAAKVQDAIRNNKIETWVVTTRLDGSTEIQVIDALGKSKSIDTSKILSQLKVKQ